MTTKLEHTKFVKLKVPSNPPFLTVRSIEGFTECSAVLLHVSLIRPWIAFFLL